MGYPPRKKQERSSNRQVCRVDATQVEIVAGVVYRHDQHDQSTQNVDGLNALFWSGFC